MIIRNHMLWLSSFSGCIASKKYRELTPLQKKIELLGQQIQKIYTDRAAFASRSSLTGLLGSWMGSYQETQLSGEKRALENRKKGLEDDIMAGGKLRLKQLTLGVSGLVLSALVLSMVKGQKGANGGNQPKPEAPTSEAPTSEAPTSEAPTSEAPTSEAPTSEAPTSKTSDSKRLNCVYVMEKSVFLCGPDWKQLDNGTWLCPADCVSQFDANVCKCPEPRD